MYTFSTNWANTFDGYFINELKHVGPFIFVAPPPEDEAPHIAPSPVHVNPGLDLGIGKVPRRFAPKPGNITIALK